jgi:hypothetical protein
LFLTGALSADVSSSRNTAEEWHRACHRALHRPAALEVLFELRFGTVTWVGQEWIQQDNKIRSENSAKGNPPDILISDGKMIWGRDGLSGELFYVAEASPTHVHRLLEGYHNGFGPKVRIEDYRMGEREACEGRITKSIHYRAGIDRETVGVTLWIDVDTYLPVKHAYRTERGFCYEESYVMTPQARKFDDALFRD